MNEISKVEQILRGQRESWKEISTKVSEISVRDLPHEAPKRILLCGLGSSHFVAHLAAYALLRDKFRNRVPVIATGSTKLGVGVVPQKGDWVFGITHRGKTPATLAALEMSEKVGAFTIQVSGLDAEISPHAKHILTTVPQEPVEPHTASVTGALVAITSLVLGNKVIEEWDALRSMGDPDLALFRRKAGKGPKAIIGEWEGEWLAREGALKLLEMAGHPTLSYSSEEFFHGPSRVLGREPESLWHISLPKDPRAQAIHDLKPAVSIDVYGSSPLAFVPALIELQWLALATSLNLGLNPDSLQ